MLIKNKYTKWFNKSKSIGLMVAGVTAITVITPLITVACADSKKEILPVNKRPKRGFYYKYDMQDVPIMKKFIEYIYYNNPVHDKYFELGLNWPKITSIELERSSPGIRGGYETDFPPSIFENDYDDVIDKNRDMHRIWNFDITFESSTPGIDEKWETSASLYDYEYSYTSEKYYSNVKWQNALSYEARIPVTSWISSSPHAKDHWNSQYEYATNVFPSIWLSGWTGDGNVGVNAPYGSNAVDIWYMIKLYHRDQVKAEQIWKEFSYSVSLDEFLIGEFYGTRWDNAKPSHI